MFFYNDYVEDIFTFDTPKFLRLKAAIFNAENDVIYRLDSGRLYEGNGSYFFYNDGKYGCV